MATASSAELGTLAGCWPGRASQVASLHSWLQGRGGSHMIVHGPPGTGKTAVVRSCLEAWGTRHAYMPLAQEYKLRQLFNSVLSQLWSDRLKRKREGGFGAVAGADSWNEFGEQVALACPPDAPACSVLVLDNLEWHAHRNLLPQLLAAIRWQRASLVVLAITTTTAQDVRFGGAVGVGLPLLRSLAFPAYTRDQLVEVLGRSPPAACGTAALPPAACPAPLPASAPTPPTPSPELYANFLAGVVVTQFSPVTRSAADLRAVADWLWPLYSLPLQTGQVPASEVPERQARQLGGLLEVTGAAKRLLAAYRPGMRSPPAAAALPDAAALEKAAAVGSLTPAGGGAAAAAAAAAEGEAEGSRALVQNLGKAAKLLLLAAFVASRNKPTLDKDLFEFRQQVRRRGRGANRAEGQAQQADRQAEAAREARLRGPHAFPLTRLISIFHRLWASAAPLESDAVAYGGAYLPYGPGTAGGAYGEPDVLDVDLTTGFAGGRTGLEAVWSQSAAVLSAVTGLQEMGLIAKHGAGEDPLEQPRFCCCIDEPLAQRIAVDVHVKLNNYLMYDK